MRGLVLPFVLALSGIAYAQPAQQAPQQYPQPQQYPPPQQYPQPQQYPPPQQPPYYGPQYAYPAQRPVMQAQLTLDEQYLLERGFITEGEHLGGGAVALFFGFGLGHAIQGRWSE